MPFNALSLTLFIPMGSTHDVHVIKSQLAPSSPDPTPDQSPALMVAFAPLGICALTLKQPVVAPAPVKVSKKAASARHASAGAAASTASHAASSRVFGGGYAPMFKFAHV